MSFSASAGVLPVIRILLSTYNGARFLRPQLESLIAQRHQGWELYWRDDGSTDETVATMREFAESQAPGRCVESTSSGPHLGAPESFLTLLAEAHDAEAVAFADQDDVWLPDKLLHAAEWLRAEGGKPVLYCARQFLVDEALRGAKRSASYAGPHQFPACLTQNIANGNTLVMNHAAAALVAAMRRPEHTVHDWWSYIVVSACGGRVIFDPRPQILYRLHKNNLIGSARPWPSRALAAIQRGPGIFMTMMHRHVDALASQPGLLSAPALHDLRVIQAALNGGVLRRLSALRCRAFRRRKLLENILFWFWFVTERRQRALDQTKMLPRWAVRERPAAE